MTYRKNARLFAALLVGGMFVSTALAGAMVDETAELEPTLPDSWVEALEWRSIGPANMGGRCIAIAVNESDPSNYWVATASGGLLKTTNNGVTFEHQFDQENTVSIGHVAVAPSDPNILYVGTGEANPRNSVSYGDGVYKSTDGGETWRHVGLRDSFQIGRIAIHPENPDIVYVGALGRLYGPNQERGLYKSTNGGDSWEQILYIDDKTGVVDVDMHPTDPDTFIVAMYERERDGFDTNDPSKKFGPGSGLYKTTDGGDTFTELTEGLPTCDLGRIGVDWYRADPNVVYAVIESERIMKLAEDTAFMGMSAEDADVGARLTEVTEGGPAAEAGLQQGDIVISIGDEQINDADELTVFVRNHRAGDTLPVEFVRDREFAQTEMTFSKRNGDEIVREFSGGLGGQRENMQDRQGYEGHEAGGIYRSEDAGDSWTRINSLNPRPMYYSQIRVDPSDDNYVYVLGTSLYKSDDAGKTFSGDGGRGGVHVDHHAMWVDPSDGRHILLGNDGGHYVTYDRMQNWEHLNKNAIGQFYHVGLDATPLYNVYGGLQDNGSWGGPSRSRTGEIVNSDWFRVGGGDGFVCLVDPNDPGQVYFESQNGAMGRLHLTNGDRGSIRPRAPRGTRFRFNWKTPFILSNHNSRIYYAAGNHVFRSLDRGNAMKIISPDITATDRGSGTAIAESPRDSDVLYVGTDDGAVWMTRDGGHSWSDLFAEAGAEPQQTETPAETDEQAGQRGGGTARGGRRAAMMRQMLSRLDANDDGKLQKSEVPERMHGLFDEMDSNSDGVIDETEIGGGEQAEEQTPAAAPDNPVGGEWSGKLKGDGIPDDAAGFTMTLTLNADNTITGSLQAETMENAAGEGTYETDSRQLTVTFKQNDRTIQLKGTLRENGSMFGTIDVANGLLLVDFEATRGDGAAAGEQASEQAEEPVEESAPATPAEEPQDEPAADPVTGTWEGTLEGEGIPPDMTFEMRLRLKDDGSVSGDVSSPQGTLDVESGTFKADSGKLTLEMVAEDGTEITLDGTVQGDSMSGNIDVGGMMSAGFKAKKIKPEFANDSCVAAPLDDQISGEWGMAFVSDEFTADFTLELMLKEGNKVSGSFSSQFNDAEIEEGTFDPESGKLSLTMSSDRGESTIDATVKENQMTGMFIAGGGQFEVEIEGKRTKPVDSGVAQASEPEEPEASADAESTWQPRTTGRLADLLPKRMWVSSIEASRFEDGRVYITFDGHRSDNDDPWVFGSEDYGQTWTSLNANLPRGSTRVIREDIENPDVLYLGTEFSAWVSIDRGETWTKLHSNLPTVAVHEFAQHPTMGEIVAGTHGRSLWILDVTPIRQMSKDTLEARSYLYEPNDVYVWRSMPGRGGTGLQEFEGENPSGGASIFYSLSSSVDNASLVVEDMAGNVIRELNASTDPGLHRVEWDLRASGGQQAGGRGGGRRNFGRAAAEGTYRAVLTVDGERSSQTFEVRADPEWPTSIQMNEEAAEFEREFQEMLDDSDQ